MRPRWNGQVVCLVVVCFLCNLARPILAADDNPLGLPRALDPNRPGAVLLHGGGRLSTPIRDRFISLAGGKQARIVLIPSGTYVRGRRGIAGEEFSESVAQFDARMRDVFSDWVALERAGRIADFKLLFTDNQQDRDDPDFVAALDRATGVWIPAAFQGKLAWRFTHRYRNDWDRQTESLFQISLRNVVARGGVVAGQGGGMAALPEVMIMGDTGQEEGPAKAELFPGLALFHGAIVDQNFEAIGGRLERFTGLLKDSALLDEKLNTERDRGDDTIRPMIGLAVERDTALLLSHNTVQVLGRQRAHVCQTASQDRTVDWRILTSADGAVSLVNDSRARAPVETGAPVGPVQANPFGLPLTATGAVRGTVVLHGGGSTRAMIPLFPTLAAVKQPHLVHCPAAAASRRPRAGESAASVQQRLSEDLHEWVSLKEQGDLASIRFLTTDSSIDANEPEFVRPLKQADAVWFSGGDQQTLCRLLVNRDAPTLFQQELVQVLLRGGVVGGSSAGTAAMARIMTVAGAPRDGQPARAEIDCGLGLLRNVVIEQHFQGYGRGGRLERFAQLLLDNERLQTMLGVDTASQRMIGLAIEERTALVLQQNRLRVVGSHDAHIFLKSNDQRQITWHQLHSGDAAAIQAGPKGPVLRMLPRE